MNKNRYSVFYMIKIIFPLCIKNNPGYYIIIQLLNITTGVLLGIGPQVSQLFFDSVYNYSIGKAVIRGVITVFTLYVFLKLATNISEGVRQYAIETHNSKVTGYLIGMINKKSSAINPVEYEDPERLDDINKATEGAGAAIYFNTVFSFIFTYHLPYFLILFIYLSNLKPVMTLCLLFTFIPVLVSHFLRSSVLSKLEDRAAPARREYDAYYNAMCGKDFFKETRILGAFQFLKSQLVLSIKALNDATIKAKKQTSLIDLGLNTLSATGYGGILLLSVKFLLAGEISIGAFAAVYSSIDIMFSVMEYLISSHIGSIADDYGKIQNFLRFLGISSEKRQDKKVDKQQDIILENVTFRYPNAKADSISNINLTIRAGETVAIVGENGAGKTTLVKLLTGLYTPTSGCVKIGNTNLCTVSYKELFNNVSGVFQKYQKYAFTLKENIQIADFNDAGGDDKVDKILSENHIDKDNPDIFPYGVDTMLSRDFDGVELSGGQWQRIAVARGFYRDSKIIVLDEPTAAIDPLEESAIYNKFINLAKNKTAIIVTHRLGSVRIAQKIVVMKDGEIAETGSHDFLIEKNGVYAEMYKAQSKWYD